VINEIHETNESTEIKEHLSILFGNHKLVHFCVDFKDGNLNII